MGKWWIRVMTDKGYRDYTWDERHGTIAEHDWLGCDHPTGSTARDLSTAEEIARRHAERQTGSSAREGVSVTVQAPMSPPEQPSL